MVIQIFFALDLVEKTSMSREPDILHCSLTQTNISFSSIHLDDKHPVKYHNLQESNTYHIIIEQKLIDCKWMYQVFVDGVMIASTENTEPLVLDEAKLYLSDPWFVTANGEITFFKIEY